MFQPPSTTQLVGGDVVADQRQDHHHDVLGDADAVRVGDLGDGEAVLDRRLQVDVVGADPGGQRQLQVRRLGDPLGGQVGGPERLRDDDVGLGQLALEDRVRPVLVGGHRQRVAAGLEELPQAKLAGDAAEQLAGREPDRLRASARSGRRGSPRSSGCRRARSSAGSRRPDRRRGRRARWPWTASILSQPRSEGKVRIGCPVS